MKHRRWATTMRPWPIITIHASRLIFQRHGDFTPLGLYKVAGHLVSGLDLAQLGRLGPTEILCGGAAPRKTAALGGLDGAGGIARETKTTCGLVAAHPHRGHPPQQP